MATVRIPNSVAARKTRMAISLRLATSNFFAGWRGERSGALEPSLAAGRGSALGEILIISGVYNATRASWQLLEILNLCGSCLIWNALESGNKSQTHPAKFLLPIRT